MNTTSLKDLIYCLGSQNLPYFYYMIQKAISIFILRYKPSYLHINIAINMHYSTYLDCNCLDITWMHKSTSFKVQSTIQIYTGCCCGINHKHRNNKVLYPITILRKHDIFTNFCLTYCCYLFRSYIPLQRIKLDCSAPPATNNKTSCSWMTNFAKLQMH